ncbi:hypothetical protein MTsPCn5_16960 [Croceitalea sp. MTPC5]|uniref:Secreted protein n=1 Tax=Croceitalea marina TaxID=1775166 RepID=A0ABW5MY40_9FLAO|nr:hypothetical protein MTsPCn5_16960 [Croceitalea sp. MTPC5]
MKAQKLIFAVAVLFTIGLSTSCTKSDIAEQDELYEQSIERDEITEDDVV